MRAFWMFTIVSLLTGCAAVYRADMVNPPGGIANSPNAPVNESARPGTIRYLNDGASFVREGRRERAYQIMREACGGDYRIDGEGPQLRDGIVIVEEDVAVALSSEYWYIQFSCIRVE